MQSLRRRLLLGVVALIGSWPIPAFGQTVIWGGGTGNWSHFSNWSCLCVPNGKGVTANIGVGPGPPPLNGTVTLDLPVSLNGVVLGNLASGTLDVDSAKNTLTTLDTYVGNTGQGTLNISGGGVVTDTIDGEVGIQKGSVGTVTVSGSGSQWNNSGTLEIGNHGRGTLNIQSGGVVTSNKNAIVGEFAGSSGSVTVSGSGSQWNNPGYLFIGNQGRGTLTVSGGGSLRISSPNGFYLGMATGSQGTATISGAGSVLSAGLFLTVGYSGQGTLTVKDGASGTSEISLIIGDHPGGSGNVTLTDPGTTWTTFESEDAGAVVGGQGVGTLTIENGAILNTNLGVVGGAAGSSGTALVTGPGSAWNNTGGNPSISFLDVGFRGKGTLTVQNGGLVTAGTLASPGTITIGTHGTVDAKGGTLQGNIVNDGTLDPLGTANIVGNYTQNSDGTLALDVAGTAPGQFGQLDVSGKALFDGTIIFDFIDCFAPQQGQSFDFINVMGTGDFSGATIDISGLKPGFKFADGFSSGAFTLTALNNGVSENTVPEPGTFLLLAAGLVGIALRRYRRRVVGMQE